MLRILLIVLLSFALSVMAEPDQPDDLMPLPELDEPPPLPPELELELELDPDLEPQITIIKQGEDTVEEYRLNGELYMIKVIPRVGLPYYLVKNRGYGADIHRGDPGSNISVPMWKILEF